MPVPLSTVSLDCEVPAGLPLLGGGEEDALVSMWAILVRLVLLLLLLDFGLLDLGGILRLDLGLSLSLSLRLILFGGGRFLARLCSLLIGLIR